MSVKQQHSATLDDLDPDLAEVTAAMRRGEMTAEEALEELVARRSSDRGPAALAAQVADILDERRGHAPTPARAEREPTEPRPRSAGPTPPPAAADRPITAEEGLQLLEELRASRTPSPEQLASQVADILERRRQHR
ncbi:MAG: hypothetical protein VYE22_41060 [Myxococcota bacterium]|nr:hypothetical protein [Myxococcota bacterium]